MQDRAHAIFHVHHALECVSHLTQRSIHGSNAQKSGCIIEYTGLSFSVIAVES